MTRFWNSPVIRFVRECVFLYFDKKISRSAACLAYFLLLTAFPLLICTNAFLGLLDLDARGFLGDFAGLLPHQTLDIIQGYLAYLTKNQSGAMLATGVIMVMFTASAAFRTLMQAMAEVYDQKPTRSQLKSVLVSILFPIALLLTVYLSILVILTGEEFLRWVAIHSPLPLDRVLSLWNSLRYLVLFCVFWLFIATMSRLAAPRGTPKLALLISSALSSFALVVASVFFSWFIGMSTKYSLVYGSLVSFVVLMIWLYLCGTILLAGNVLGCVWFQLYQDLKEQRD